MSLAIAGCGWVTPLGSGIDEVWATLLAGNEANAETIADSSGNRRYPVFAVPPAATSALPPHARLRRSSAISRFAVAAGLAAMENAKSKSYQVDPEKTALILAVSNGGVVYTKRFYHDIMQTGAQAASPLLFPETVFNAPASHLAAMLGLTGATYTVVGDAAVGVGAIQMAADLMASEAIDHCLVVGAEEKDWLLCDAYRRWRLTRSAPPIELFYRPPRGTILSEGAGAILLAREGAVRIANIHAGHVFRRRSEIPAKLRNVFDALGAKGRDAFVLSANGSFVDLAEFEALQHLDAISHRYTFKPALGESAGSAAIWQVITGAQMLLQKQMPPILHTQANLIVPESHEAGFYSDRVIVSVVGLNQQLAGLSLSI